MRARLQRCDGVGEHGLVVSLRFRAAVTLDWSCYLGVLVALMIEKGNLPQVAFERSALEVQKHSLEERQQMLRELAIQV